MRKPAPDFGALHRNFGATINSDVTLKLMSLHIHLISGSFISRRQFKISNVCLEFLNSDSYFCITGDQ
jgi:hypothetical protein